MLFLHLFRTLQGKVVVVTLKNSIVIKGILESVDHFYNIKLLQTEVLDTASCQITKALSSAFIRGSSILYIERPKEEVDLELLHDAIIRQESEASQDKKDK